MAEALKNFSSFKTTSRIIKLLFDGLRPDRLIFSGNSHSTKKMYLLLNSDNADYNVITNINAAMVKKFICNACDTLYDETQM